MGNWTQMVTSVALIENGQLASSDGSTYASLILLDESGAETSRRRSAAPAPPVATQQRARRAPKPPPRPASLMPRAAEGPRPQRNSAGQQGSAER